MSKEYTQETELKDKFTIVENKIDSFPKPVYKYEVYNLNRNDNQKMLAETEYLDIEMIYDSQEVRCYTVSSYANELLYNKDNSSYFESIKFDDLKNKKIQNYKFLIPALREVLVRYEDGIFMVGDVLIDSNDQESIDIVYVK